MRDRPKRFEQSAVHPLAWGTLLVPGDLERRSAVHPHSRGDTCLAALFQFAAPIGSPPLAWGIHPAKQADAPMQRFTPTRVGNTCPCSRDAVCVARGSPPLAWGIRHGDAQRRDPRTVHPHSRGEYVTCAHGRAINGSSPTRVGNIAFLAAQDVRPVHPHSRGEHSSRMNRDVQRIGSSPLAWGTLVPRWHIRPDRFIPTRVGNITLRNSVRRASPVHPHSRGEHGGLRVASSRLPYGSSPLAWGTCIDITTWAITTRFIPTRVGNMIDNVLVDAAPVHPHSRGEHPGQIRDECAGDNRFIPTRVGNMRSKPETVPRPTRFIPTRVGNVGDE